MTKRYLLPLLLLLPAACSHRETAHDRAQADCQRQANISTGRLDAGGGELATQANRTARDNAVAACMGSRGYITPVTRLLRRAAGCGLMAVLAACHSHGIAPPDAKARAACDIRAQRRPSFNAQDSIAQSADLLDRDEYVQECLAGR